MRRLLRNVGEVRKAVRSRAHVLREFVVGFLLCGLRVLDHAVPHHSLYTHALGQPWLFPRCFPEGCSGKRLAREIHKAP